ncbi:MAG: DUF2877 domain-containing protein [Actinomycetota bacterium]|nr:DUF2877 domain-containing protein [Actinomycetota bacterium]
MTICPVAAAAPLTPLLTGPRTTGSVLAVFSAAAILGVTPADGTGPRIVSLLSRQASGVPNGVRLPMSAADAPFAALQPGTPATVGAREIVLGDAVYRLARTWHTAVPAIRPGSSALETVAGRLAQVQLGVPTDRVATLAAGLVVGDPDPAVRRLIGLGSGLTPGGDDLLAGLLVGLRASGKAVLLQQVRHAVGSDWAATAERTTSISVDLLRLAAAGHASTETLALLTAIHRTPPGAGHAYSENPRGAAHLSAAQLGGPRRGRHHGPLHAAIDKLLAVGHTSGSDLATGLLMGLRPIRRVPATGRPPGLPVQQSAGSTLIDAPLRNNGGMAR